MTDPAWTIPLAQAPAALLEPWQWEALLRMALSLAIGGVVGLEREYHGRAAGFRTHILVCMGCCVIMLVSTNFVRLYEHLGTDTVVRLDPARLAYGVVTGVGFLGAGVIMKNGVTVHGLTTAASLWSVAALGLSMGVGMYVVAGFGTVLTLVSLLCMRHIGGSIQQHHYRTVRLTHKDTEEISSVTEKLTNAGGKVLSAAVDHHCSAGTIVRTYNVRFQGERSIAELYEMVRVAGTFERIEVE